MAETKKTAPIGYFQLLGSGKSGWMLKGTENTPTPIELMFPQARNVMNRGFRKRKSVHDDGNGGTYETYDLEEVRYIGRQPEIRVTEQDARNIKPHKSIHDGNLDWITFKNGEITVAREGSFIGMYDYLKFGTSQNVDNPFRVEEADEVFHEIKLNQEAEEVFDFEDIQEEAKKVVRSWREKVGGEWIYNSEKIEIASQVFGVPNESDQVRLRVLMQRANDLPKDFLEKLKRMEQTAITEVHQALQLRVIEFTGNLALYVEATVGRKDAIKSLGQGKLSQENKVEKLADWFRVEEGNGAYKIFRAELEAEKEKQLTEK